MVGPEVDGANLDAAMSLKRAGATTLTNCNVGMHVDAVRGVRRTVDYPELAYLRRRHLKVRMGY